MMREQRRSRRTHTMSSTVPVLGALVVALTSAGGAMAQERAGLAGLIEEARTGSPEVAAARRMADAAAERVPQAGALPDPVLSAGLMNVPTTFDLGQEGMTMASVQLGQRLPAPGSRSAREAMAREEYRAADREAEEVELGVVTRLKDAYYELLFVERASAVLSRNRALLVDLAEVARARFAVGRAPQQDVLRAQTEITRIEEQMAGIEARRTASVAEVNALLGRPALAPVDPVYPDEVRALALSGLGPGAFTARALDGGLGPGLPSLAELQERALRERPVILADRHRLAAARDRVRLAEHERFPDLELMVGYGTRWDRRDMVSAGVAVPLPVFAGRKQRRAVVEAEHELDARQLRHHQLIADVRADVAARYAAVVRTREQVLLLNEGVIPQAQATIESAMAAYQAGRVEFAGLLEAQATLFRNQIELARRMADFGRELAALERAAGVELREGGTDDAR